MKSLYLFMAFFFIVPGDSFCQRLAPIPDLTFWNTSYTYHFQYTQKDDTDTGKNFLPESEIDNLLQPKTINDSISSCYLGKGKIGFLPCEEIDTNIDRLLSKAIKLFEKQSIINLDYYDGKDTTYKSVLLYLYNASVDTNE